MSVALGRGAAALAFSRALLFPTMALPRSPWRRCVVLCLSPTAASGTPIGGVVSCLAFPNGGSWDFPPRPRRVGCSPLAFDCALIRPRRGRSPFKVVSSSVDVCFALSTDTPRDGGDAGGLCSTLAAAYGGALRAVHIPKTERGNSESNEFAPRLPRSVFRLRRASPPIQ